MTPFGFIACEILLILVLWTAYVVLKKKAQNTTEYYRWMRQDELDRLIEYSRSIDAEFFYHGQRVRYPRWNWDTTYETFTLQDRREIDFDWRKEGF